LIVHLNGIGPLSTHAAEPPSSQSVMKERPISMGPVGPEKKKQTKRTHELKKDDVNSCARGAGRSSASVAGRNPNVASMFAIADHNMSRAKKRPGQIRRPNPNMSSGGGSADVTGSRKRSGLNLDGSGSLGTSQDHAGSPLITRYTLHIMGGSYKG
jgi:hypothetical protein